MHDVTEVDADKEVGEITWIPFHYIKFREVAALEAMPRKNARRLMSRAWCGGMVAGGWVAR